MVNIAESLLIRNNNVPIILAILNKEFIDLVHISSISLC